MSRGTGFRKWTLPILFEVADDGPALERAMDESCQDADAAIREGVAHSDFSDRGIDREHAAIPALLAVSGLHHHLICQGTRTRVSLVVEFGEPREVHHFATLVGYGASAVNPYLLYETVADIDSRGHAE